MLDAMQVMAENDAQDFLTTLYEILADTLNNPVSVALKIYFLLQEWVNLYQHDAHMNLHPAVRTYKGMDHRKI